MPTKTNHLKIGAFVLGGIVLLLGGLFAFGVRSRFEPTTTFETYVAGDVEGLSVGSPVKLRGVPVGKVTRINFTWNEYHDGGKGYVMVAFEIKDSVSPLPSGEERDRRLQAEIRKGLRARIRGQGITGTSIVSLEYLEPGENPALEITWTPARYYIPSAPGQFTQMLTSIERSLRNLEKFDFELLNLSLQNSLDTLGKVLRSAEGLQLGRLSTNVNGFVTELRLSNSKLKEFLEESRGAVQNLKLEGLARRAETLLADLSQVAGRLDNTLQHLHTAPLGQTLSNAREATEQLNEVLHELKQYPSGFLFGQPPSPARSVDRPKKP